MTSTSSDCRKPSEKASTCACGSGVSSKSSVPALPPIDNRGDIFCRLSDKFRMNYKVAPGLYSLGSPNRSSPVLVTANYRLTCDHLRGSMDKGNAWVLVLDTKGINVWCAAGKGTFGTSELINRIKCTNLETFVNHKNLILPQLGAPGVSAHEVTKATGFKISYGPILARDIPAYLSAGNKATEAMRTVRFSFRDRIVLIPMELNASLRKFPWLILGLFIVMGIEPPGILFKPGIAHSLPIIALCLLAVLPGSTITPALLPWIPFRSFAAKGAVVGTIVSAPLLLYVNQLFAGSVFLTSSVILFLITLISYCALNFTGCTPFTSISGVKREMKFSVPAYISMCVLSIIFLLVFKLQEWGVL